MAIEVDKKEPSTGDISIKGNDAVSVENGDATDEYVIDKAIERKMLRKFDITILPTLATMYLMKYAFTNATHLWKFAGLIRVAAQ